MGQKFNFKNLKKKINNKKKTLFLESSTLLTLDFIQKRLQQFYDQKLSEIVIDSAFLSRVAILARKKKIKMDEPATY